jgi:predicted SPOUT superfamily RNA methylase MTH1
VATSYDANVGIAIPSSHVLEIVGDDTIITTGVGSVLTISALYNVDYRIPFLFGGM